MEETDRPGRLLLRVGSRKWITFGLGRVGLTFDACKSGPSLLLCAELAQPNGWAYIFSRFLYKPGTAIL